MMPRRALPPKRGIPNVKKVVAVASGKGGVGKSTVAGSSSPSSLYIFSHEVWPVPTTLILNPFK